MVYIYVSLVVCFIVSDICVYLRYINKSIDINFVIDFYPFFHPISIQLFYFMLGGIIKKYFNDFKISKSICITLLILSNIWLLIDWVMMSKIGGYTINTVISLYNSISVLIMTTCSFMIFKEVKIKLKFDKILKFISD